MPNNQGKPDFLSQKSNYPGYAQCSMVAQTMPGIS